MENEADMGQEKQAKINNNIRAREVLLIDENGKNIGNTNLSKALGRALELGLDLVQVNSNDVPVCRIMDYGKWRYEQSKRQKKNRGQKKTTKEIKFRPNTGNNDMLYRAKQASRFLKEGHKVKLCVRFRGRELEHMFDTGRSLLEKFLNMISVDYKMIGNAVAEGKNITLTIELNDDNN